MMNDWEMEAIEKEAEDNSNRCQYCYNKGASYVANPFDEDVNDIINMEWICDECYNNIAGDI